MDTLAGNVGELLGIALVSESHDQWAISLMLVAREAIAEGDMSGMARATGYLTALSVMRDSDQINDAAAAMVAWMVAEVELLARPRGMVN